MPALGFAEAADRVKQSLDVVEVVQRHVMLKKSGRNFTGLCPFHKDKNPSMSVHREKGLFKCFACGVGGDALAFLMKIENKTYGEVIKDLALEQGIDIIYEGQSAEKVAAQRDLRQKIIDLNNLTLAWFERQLQSNTMEAKQTKQYLAGRQLDDDIIARFHLGYAPQGWDNLRNYLIQKSDDVRENLDLLVTAGLGKPKINQETGSQSSYDAFRHRLIIPIHDDKGNAVAFGGRALSDDDKPKYLNSPETPVYVKSRILYGLWQAKTAITETKSAVIMEGYFDVIRAHWGGITQAVGSCGTALTDGHLKLLSRYGAETIYLAFDSDEAGLKAALSAIAIIEPYLENNPITVKIAVTPSGKDPDDFIRDNGGEAFKALMTDAPGHLDFKFEMALRGIDFNSSEARVEAANRLTPLLAAIGQPVLRAEFLRKYAEQVGITEEALLLEVKRYEQAKNPTKSYYPVNFKKKSSNWKHGKAIQGYDRRYSQRNQYPVASDNLSELRKPLPPDPLSRIRASERLLLRFLLANQDTCRIMLALLHQRQLIDPIHQMILDAVALLVQQESSAANPQPEQGMESLIRKLMHMLSQQADAQSVVADVAMPSGETLCEEFAVKNPSSQVWTEIFTREVERYSQMVSGYEQKKELLRLQSEEQDEIELQYLIQEKLAARRPASEQS